MVTIEGLDALSKRLGAIIGRIRHFKQVDIGQVLSAWQTEEMHRKRPFTMRARRVGRASTIIRPHSLFEMKHSRRATRRAIRRHKPPPARWSTRPILRDQLLSELQSRLEEALQEKIHW
jgi:hypothetical protein